MFHIQPWVRVVYCQRIWLIRGAKERGDDETKNHFNLQIQANHSQSKNCILYSCQKTTSYEAPSGIVLHSNLINAVEKGPYRALVLLITAI